MRKAVMGASLLVATGLALVGCGSTSTNTPAASAGGTAASAPKVTPIAVATPTSDGKTPRGNFAAEIGDVGTSKGSVTGEEITKFTVTGIGPAACDQPYASAATNGRLVAVDISVETTPALAKEIGAKFSISASSFKFIADSGTTFNGSLGTAAGFMCLSSAAQFPSAGIGPSEKAAGKVVVDIPNGPGILVLNNHFGYGTGYEYKVK